MIALMALPQSFRRWSTPSSAIAAGLKLALSGDADSLLGHELGEGPSAGCRLAVLCRRSPRTLSRRDPGSRNAADGLDVGAAACALIPMPAVYVQRRSETGWYARLPARRLFAVALGAPLDHAYLSYIRTATPQDRNLRLWQQLCI